MTEHDAQLHSDYVDLRRDATHTPEQRLWVAVLACAIRDLRAGGDLAERVKRWAFRRGKDEAFREVCDMAGYDPDAVRAGMVRYLESKNQPIDPIALDQLILTGYLFHPAETGAPAHEVIERIKELRAAGYDIVRVGGGMYRHQVTPPPRPSKKPRKRGRPKKIGVGAMPARPLPDDYKILSGEPFSVSAGGRRRARIDYLRTRGFVIASLGNCRFVCQNPPQ